MPTTWTHADGIFILPRRLELLFYSKDLTKAKRKWDNIGIKVGASHLFYLNEKGNRYLFKRLLEKIGKKRWGGGGC